MLCLKFEQINLKLRKCSRAPTMGGTVCIIQSSQCPSSGTRGEKSVADLPSTSLNGACLIAGFVTLFCLSVEQCHIFASTLCCYVEFYLSMKYISDSLLTEDRQTSPPKSKSTGVMIIMIWERTNSQVLVRKRTTKILEQIRLDMGAWHEEKSHLESPPTLSPPPNRVCMRLG